MTTENGVTELISHRNCVVELQGCAWAPLRFARDSKTYLCRNAAGSLFLATNVGGIWLDADDLERDPSDILLGIK